MLVKNSLTVLQIILTSGGAIALIIATVLSLNQVTNINSKIGILDIDIAKLRDGRIMGSIVSINYGKDFVFRRIELLERNLMIIHNQPESGIEELTKRAFDKTGKMAKQWSYWYGGEEAEQLEEETSNKLMQIKKNTGLSPLEKIDAAEDVWQESMTKANERLQNAQKQLQEKERQKKHLENDRQRLHNQFIAWQLGGLVALALGGLIEGFLRLSISKMN